MSNHSGRSSQLPSHTVLIAICHLNVGHLNALGEIPDATNRFMGQNPGFRAVTLSKVTGGLAGRLDLPLSECVLAYILWT